MNAVFRSDVISIMIPCYNCEKFLPTCLEALLRQTWPLEKMELILVNDGSSDSTWEIIKTYESVFRAGGADFLKISQENSGVGAAVNSALKYISGEFFMWQDSDDWYEPDALEKLHSYLKKHKDTGFVRGEVNFRSEDAPEKILRVGSSSQKSPKDIGKDLILRRDMYCLAGCFMGGVPYFLNIIRGVIFSPRVPARIFNCFFPLRRPDLADIYRRLSLII